MPIVRSFGALQSVSGQPTWNSAVSAGSLSLYSATAQTYAKIYQTQPNVRICVDFLARNIAQLGIHIFRRVSDTDRVRVNSHQLSSWLEHPNPATSRYRLIESLMSDLGIYFNAYWLKVRSEPMGLIRLPPDQMAVEGSLLPSAFVWTLPDGSQKRFAPSEIVYFNGYNPDPDNPLMGLSPLETLRRILAEEYAASAYREAFWSNGARFEGVIQRPSSAPKWTKEQKADWREQWQAKFGNGGAGAGSVAVLEDGMEFKETSFSAKDSEYTAGGKLRREVCAAAYHIPQPMVGILDHATFSNVKEQHKHTYQDTLGPWCEMIVQEFERQLLVECDDQRDIYVEFNIAEKLKGSFEEQAASLQTLVGRPIMTANEGRSRINLPSIDSEDANSLAPQQGGPGPAPDRAPADDAEMSDDAAALARPIIKSHRARQEARISKLHPDDRAEAFSNDIARWNRELAADLAPLVGRAAAAHVAVRVNADTLARLEEEQAHV